MVHGKGHATKSISSDGVAGNESSFVNNLFVFRTKLAQHEIYLTATREFAANAELQSIVGLCSKHLCYVL